MSENESLPRRITSRLPDGRGGVLVLEFELLDHIGSGGMGTVFRARHLNPPESYVKKFGDKPRIVAVKYLSRHMMRVSDEAVPRFVREALLLQSLHHRNIVRIHGLGIDQEGVPFIAMELVENARSLASLRDVSAYHNPRLDPESGKTIGSLVPLGTLIPILRQTCEALREVHAKGIVHRDIKPDNILVTEDGTVKLTDFGISKGSEMSQGPSLTVEGRVVGTPSYVSPEAASECRIDPRTGKAWYVSSLSDIYQLGVVTYELMSGILPFDADESELPDGSVRSTQTKNQLVASLILGRVVTDHFKPKPLGDLLLDTNPVMVALVEACMSKGPWDRPASCEVLLEVLDQAEAYEKTRGDRSDQATTQDFGAKVSGELALAPTQLDSVPPAAQSRNSRSGSSSSVNIKQAPLPRPGPQPEATSQKKSFPMSWAVASLLLVGAICGVLWWTSSAMQQPRKQSSAKAIPAPSTESGPVVPLQPSAMSDKQKPDPGPVPGTRSYTVFQGGAAAARSGDCRRAIADMNAVLAVFPAFPKPFKILGDCARIAGDREGARKNYGKYLSFEGVEPLQPEAMKLVNP